MFTPWVAPSIQLCLENQEPAWGLWAQLGQPPSWQSQVQPSLSDMEAKNPRSGFVTGLLVNEEAWEEVTASSVTRKSLIPGPLSLWHIAFDIGACTGASCFNSQPHLL